ncbi:hypothetical protein NOF04DRAFT_1358896 [Fusarium oxysporum II5]|nr:hypothetical protein NOF04DRAFT_1358896 [Fusarium oxysporum II5]
MIISAVTDIYLIRFGTNIVVFVLSPGALSSLLIQAAEICRVKSDQKMTIPPVVCLCFTMIFGGIGADLELQFGLSQAGARGLARASDRARVMPTPLSTATSKPYTELASETRVPTPQLKESGPSKKPCSV